MVFFVGILPALLTLWIRRGVPESELWIERHTPSKIKGTGSNNELGDAPGISRARAPAPHDSFFAIFRSPYLKNTLVLLLLNFFGLFAWWGMFTWIPPYLSLPVAQGGRGFGIMGTASLLIVLNLLGMFPGYICFGWLADRLGRRNCFMLYLFVAALLVPVYAMARSQMVLLIVGTVIAFFGSGFFSGSSLVGSEIFPTRLRARALGFTYNGARTLSSVAPFVIGRVGQAKGLSWAFYLCGGAYLLAGLMATQLPETRGKSLD